MTRTLDNRRPLKSRDTRWARWAAAALARRGISPDLISAGSILSAALGGGAFVAAGSAHGSAQAGLLLAAAAAIQARLGCNLLDGMVAVEHGRGGPAGPIWNELPDRIADTLFLVGAGYFAALGGVSWGRDAGWAAALLAVLTAYVRELGRGLGQPADFSGPGAKPQRMGLLTALAVVAAVAARVDPARHTPGALMAGGLGAIAVVAAIAVTRRTLNLAARLAAPSGH
jgi:phosphatidylglycerophosphate synthase